MTHHNVLTLNAVSVVRMNENPKEGEEESLVSGTHTKVFCYFYELLIPIDPGN